MKYPLQQLALCIAVLATAACASKTPLQVEGVAKTGRQYTDTLKKVNAHALDQSLEFTADLLPSLPRDSTTLQQQTDAMRERVRLLNEAAHFFDTQAMYFAELDALAKGDTSTGTARALKKLVEALNKTPDLGGIRRVTKDAAAELAGHVATWKHSADVSAVLQRDAETVANALLLNERILQEQIDWLNRRDALLVQVEYREKVEKPFLGDKKLPEAWKKAWVTHLKRPSTLQLLEQARQASLQMHQAWVDVLRGQGSFDHLRTQFDQINRNLKAVSSDEQAGI